jgi:hypothetical protein
MPGLADLGLTDRLFIFVEGGRKTQRHFDAVEAEVCP